MNDDAKTVQQTEWKLTDALEVGALTGALRAQADARQATARADAGLDAVMQRLSVIHQIPPMTTHTINVEATVDGLVLKATPIPVQPERAPEALKVLDKVKRKGRG